jgi:hypothetical protein
MTLLPNPTGVLHPRRPLDAYYTPDALALACVRHIGAPTNVIEPSVGGGAFVRAVKHARRTAYVLGIDINPDAPGLPLCDTSRAGCWLEQPEFPAPDWWVIGNPPYGDAEAHVRKALAMQPAGVAMLLRLSFIGSRGRSKLFAEHPLSELAVVVGRPSFTGGGTDSSEYGLFIWRDHHTGPSRLSHLHWS